MKQFQTIKTSSHIFYQKRSSEEITHEVMTEVLMESDTRARFRKIVYDLMAAIHNCTNWIDKEHKKCLADHRMSRLLEVKTQYRFAHIMQELYRIGCVIEKSDHAGGDDRPLMRNIQNMQKFQQEIVNLEQEFGQPHAEVHSQEEEEVWTSQQWTAWQWVQKATAHPNTEPTKITQR